MYETNSWGLRHHTPVLPAKQDDEATALGESEAGYSAAQRLLDEAVDQAVGEEYPAPPAMLVRKNEPPVVPEPPNDEYEPLKFGRISIDVSQLRKRNSLEGKWYLSLWYSNYKASFEAAALDMAEAFTEAAAGLRQLAGKPSNGQPSVTAGTSAALVESYTEDSTEAAR